MEAFLLNFPVSPSLPPSNSGGGPKKDLRVPVLLINFCPIPSFISFPSEDKLQDGKEKEHEMLKQ